MSADLQLRIGAPDEFQQPIAALTHAVAGAVHAAAVIGERVAHETFAGQLALAAIALGHARAADIQLADRTGRQRLTLRIQHIDARIEQRPANRRCGGIGQLQRHDGRPDRGFGRPVQLGQAPHPAEQLRGQFGHQRLATDQRVDAIQHQILIGQQDAPQRWRSLHHADVFVGDQPRQAAWVVADTGRCDDHARAHQQRQVQLQPGDIEGDGGDCQHTIARTQCQLVLHRMQEIEQVAMADLHALGRTGGAGGVQHVRGAVGRRQRCDRFRQHGRARIQPDHATEQIALAQCRLADQADGAGIVEHLAVARGRALRIQRQVRRTAPHHRQQRHQQLFAARQRHRDHIARAHAIGHPLRGDARGELAQRGVVERAVVVLRHHGRRHQLGALQHAVQQRGRFRQRRCGVVPGVQQTPALAIAEHIDLAQRAFRIG